MVSGTWRFNRFQAIIEEFEICIAARTTYYAVASKTAVMRWTMLVLNLLAAVALILASAMLTAASRTHAYIHSRGV